MPPIVIHPDDRQLEPVASAEGLPPERTILRRIVSEDRPYAHIVEVPAGHHVDLHSHSEPEITIILTGTMTIAGERCGPGTVVLVPAAENYALEVGDEPVTFVVVRPARAAFVR